VFLCGLVPAFVNETPHDFGSRRSQIALPVSEEWIMAAQDCERNFQRSPDKRRG
jgi:hypothetical protein